MARSTWFGIRKELSSQRQFLLMICSFVGPLLIWCAFSYIPFLWHPMVLINDPGDTEYFQKDMLVERGVFAEENALVKEKGGRLAVGVRANPIYLPAPHKVFTAFYSAFKTPPRRRGEMWLHESLLHSIKIIFWGFTISSIIGVPLGILCGTFSFASKIQEPFIDFVRYMPAPVFGSLAVAILGIHDGPKIAIIFIGTFFQQVLVVGNTTRKLDISLLEAAQTLGANNMQLLTRVIVPGILPNLYRDLRILLGWAWTYLIVAELIGASSGISYFIAQQAKYRNFENVYAAIIMIGLIGLFTDQFLAFIGNRIFPYQRVNKKPLLRGFFKWIGNCFKRERSCDLKEGGENAGDPQYS